MTKCSVINIVSPNFKNIDYFLALKNKCKIVKLFKINFWFLSSFLKSARALCLWQCLAMNSANAKYDTYHRNYINTIINLYYECSVNNNQIMNLNYFLININYKIKIFFFKMIIYASKFLGLFYVFLTYAERIVILKSMCIFIRRIPLHVFRFSSYFDNS